MARRATGQAAHGEQRGRRRHLRALLAAWRGQRGEAKGPSRRRLELEFLPAYLEILERPPSRVGRLLGLAIMLLCAGALIWSVRGRLDVIATAPGRVIVGQYSKTVQAAAGGVVTDIRVRDGQTVRAGEVLVELNPTSARADLDRLRRQVESNAASVARFEALLSDDPVAEFAARGDLAADQKAQALTYLEGEWLARTAARETYLSQLRQIAAQQLASAHSVAESETLLRIAQDRHDSMKPLAEKGIYARMDLLTLQKQVVEQRRTLAEQTDTLAVLQVQQETLVSENARQEAEWRQSVLQRLEQSRADLGALGQELIKAQETARMQTIAAPVDGVVQQLAVHTIGGVVQAGQALMMVVPETDDLEAEVNILNRDAGFVRRGQPVQVKVESFPYTKYGTITGEVLQVSRDSVSDETLGLVYPARVRLDRLSFSTDDGAIPLSAGMELTAEIRTDERRVIDYLLSPLQEYQSMALRER
ncbi:HlyD family type I secretion periplasmic adaptor subunit [Phyllobacterium phragmitis]|uniref:Membrane fusion protein (MFP) family protein n=1 Tax=Phyllobacterium phragmitis TaxID=2670329 RepID=A0A2S9IJR3_9HYPH|nr:HlyD family type I secretion periplasmic adaptor subunit [Phyllobacterium phragmitis]PRD40773.1 HlyD family type I secretion periplasmic adaptor subunit [Phyllobacterium phragmitis]